MKRNNKNKKIYEYITIKGNKGIPGEHGENKDKEKKYLSDVEKRAHDRLGLSDIVNKPMYVKNYYLNNLTKRLNQLNMISQKYIKGKEKELEKLALDVIKSEYESILDGVILDIKFVKYSGELSDMLSDNDIEMPIFQIFDDPKIRNEVDKRKILNNICQGEAKNTKRIIALPEIRDGLKKIYGSEKIAKQLQDVWLEITSIADKLDWFLPVDARVDMIKHFGHISAAGAVSVDWVNDVEINDEDKIEHMENIINKINSGDVDDINDFEEDLSAIIGDTKPVIKARGVDFPMLIHEAIKGIYELIIAAGIPEDKEVAEIVLLNTSSIEDEFEEFKYGPEIASDLRDFINKTSVDIDKYPNMRERFCGKLAEMPADEFLFLMKNILMETPYARKRVDEILMDIIKELDEYYNDVQSYSSKKEYNVKDDDDYTVDNDDYSKLSQSEIINLIDKALDDKDYKKVEILRKYLKESLSSKYRYRKLY